MSKSDLGRILGVAPRQITRWVQGELRTAVLPGGRVDLGHSKVRALAARRGVGLSPSVSPSPVSGSTVGLIPMVAEITPEEAAAAKGVPVDDVLDDMSPGGPLEAARTRGDGLGYLCLARVDPAALESSLGLTVDELVELAREVGALSPRGRYVCLARLLEALPE